MRFVETQPPTAWNQDAPKEYGFYSNVNPNVDHPRWSQKTERRITGSFFGDLKRIPTSMFNGYGEVASMYSGMDLTNDLSEHEILLLKVCVWAFALGLVAYLVYARSRISSAPTRNRDRAYHRRWTLRFLLITLAITPIRRLTGWNWIIRFRRLLGLFAFFYASLHFFAYTWFDQNFVWSSIVAEMPSAGSSMSVSPHGCC